jgi:poly-gamma-glutamate capsule biosynthesis protein CapA/YwtB (metallophosphatase superfamily)
MSVYGSRRNDGEPEYGGNSYRSPESTGNYRSDGYDTPGPYQGPTYGPPSDPMSNLFPPPPQPAAQQPPPRRRRSGVNRATIIIAVLAVLLIGAGTAAAATLLTGDDKPTQDGQAPAGGDGKKANPPASSAPAKAAITMSATGDTVMGQAPSRVAPNNGKGMFDAVAPLLKADFQMMNLEQTLTDDTGVAKCAAGSTSCTAFRTAPATVQNLKDVGVHLVNMANNHAYDFGEKGYKNTQAALDGAGIKYTGAPDLITVSEVKGVKVAVVGFASYEKWSNLCSNLDTASALIKKAAGQADIVVVQVHMGAEGSDKTHVKPGTEFAFGENRCDPIKFTHAVIDAGADLVVGHGPHVVRGMEFYQGRLIAYSLGNFTGYGGALVNSGILGVTAVIKISLNPDGTWGSGTLIPTYMADKGIPKPDPNKRAITTISGLTKSDFPQTGPTIAADGTITAPK